MGSLAGVCMGVFKASNAMRPKITVEKVLEEGGGHQSRGLQWWAVRP